MSGNRYLLDSNVIIDVFRGDAKTIGRMQGIEEIYVPAIVIGELYYGAHKSNQIQRRIAEVEQLQTMVTVLEVNATTAQLYGKIKAQLYTQGSPIPENDLWIAAIATEHAMILITRDAHFEHVEGIKIEKP